MATLELKSIKSYTAIYSKQDVIIDDSFLCIGNNGRKICRVFLLFDMDSIPQNENLDFVLLKIYLSEIYTYNRRVKLFIEDVAPDEGDAVAEWVPGRIVSSVCCCYHGWAYIDLGEFIKKDTKKLSLRISGDERVTSSIRLSDNAGSSLFLGISDNSIPTPVEYIRTSEEEWHLAFSTSTTSPVLDVGRIKQGTFFVTNTGENIIMAAIETSADSENWIRDAGTMIGASETRALVGKFYGKFYRIKVDTMGLGEMDIHFVGQFYL